MSGGVLTFSSSMARDLERCISRELGALTEQIRAGGASLEARRQQAALTRFLLDFRAALELEPKGQRR